MNVATLGGHHFRCSQAPADVLHMRCPPGQLQAVCPGTSNRCSALQADCGPDQPLRVTIHETRAACMLSVTCMPRPVCRALWLASVVSIRSAGAQMVSVSAQVRRQDLSVRAGKQAMLPTGSVPCLHRHRFEEAVQARRACIHREIDLFRLDAMSCDHWGFGKLEHAWHCAQLTDCGRTDSEHQRPGRGFGGLVQSTSASPRLSCRQASCSSADRCQPSCRC